MKVLHVTEAFPPPLNRMSIRLPGSTMPSHGPTPGRLLPPQLRWADLLKTIAYRIHT
jgi:hypothetical protein